MSSTMESSSEEAKQRAIEEVVRMTGRTFVQLQSSWWGNEKLGMWESALLGSVLRVTEKAVLIGRVVPVGDALRYVKAANGVDLDEGQLPDDFDERVRNKVRGKAWGEPRKRAKQGWFPKSKVVKMISHPGPEEFQVFPADGSGPITGRAGDADIVVREEMVTQGRYRQYRKLAVDADYEVNQEINDLPEEPWHPRYEFSRSDDFMCMTVSNNPGRFARMMQERGHSVAVHEDLLDD